MRPEDCLCGGVILALDGEEAAGVRTHQKSLMHVMWRWRREVPTASFWTRDLSEPLRCASVPPAEPRSAA
jgi:hypothetical protein